MIGIITTLIKKIFKNKKEFDYNSFYINWAESQCQDDEYFYPHDNTISPLSPQTMTYIDETEARYVVNHEEGCHTWCVKKNKNLL